MFPEIEAHNDFIQFESGWLGDTDTAFIWDLKNN